MCCVKVVAIGGRFAPKFQSFVGVELQDSNVCRQGRCGRAFRVWCLSCQVVEKEDPLLETSGKAFEEFEAPVDSEHAGMQAWL